MLGKSLPSSWYYDETHYENERSKIFGREWIYITSTSRLVKPGDYSTLNIVGYKVMVIKQEDGSIKAFLNACRHRASPLLLESHGTCKGQCITCPYHAWTYNLDGNLRKAPEFEMLPDFSEKKTDLSLVPVQIHESCGLIFFNLSKNIIDNKRQFDELIEIMNGYPTQNYVYHSTKTFEIACNWKVFIENYQECYHCKILHPLFDKNYALKKYKVTNAFRLSHHTCELKHTSNNEKLGSKEGEWIWVWPNLTLALYEKYYDTVQIIPVNSKKTKLIVTFYGRQDLSNKDLDIIINEVSFQTFSEDIIVCERVQESLESGLINVDGGPLHPIQESGVIYFDELIRQSMSSPCKILDF